MRAMRAYEGRGRGGQKSGDPVRKKGGKQREVEGGNPHGRRKRPVEVPRGYLAEFVLKKCLIDFVFKKISLILSSLTRQIFSRRYLCSLGQAE